ncbi:MULTISPECIES: hypothetical protein [Candidatus Ichthyocystis]|uniref:Uncharacterized protein n=1 Tax=Candidatus Ichthyocystis hellenicum TaxID=1561003 RepID=A0A0S4M517_9BURK|nr:MULTISPECIES: hypothetical protein [Ichthyocystis]CUT18060.1 hypothetical protein Ark11_1254 [Candidatus Ichthyocystis hellenicum]
MFRISVDSHCDDGLSLIEEEHLSSTSSSLSYGQFYQDNHACDFTKEPSLAVSCSMSSNVESSGSLGETSQVLISIEDDGQCAQKLLTSLMITLGYTLRAQSRPGGPTEDEFLCMNELQSSISEIVKSKGNDRLSFDDLKKLLQDNLLLNLSGAQDLCDRVDLISRAVDDLYPGEVFPFPEPTGNSVSRFFTKCYRFMKYSRNPFFKCFFQAIWIFFTHTCYEYMSYGCCLFLQNHDLDALTVCKRIISSIKKCCQHRSK